MATTIRNGTVVNHDGMFKADVVTREGKIVKVGVVSDAELKRPSRSMPFHNACVTRPSARQQAMLDAKVHKEHSVEETTGGRAAKKGRRRTLPST